MEHKTVGEIMCLLTINKKRLFRDADKELVPSKICSINKSFRNGTVIALRKMAPNRVNGIMLPPKRKLNKGVNGRGNIRSRQPAEKRQL